MPILSFNVLLCAAGFEPATVRLMRHRRSVNQRLLFDAALKREERFEQYQSGQCNPRVIASLRDAGFMAAFVVDPMNNETMFVGVWRIENVKPGHLPDPFETTAGTPRPGSVVVVTSRDPRLDDYAGKLVVNWGDGERAWVQRAERQDKALVELRRQLFVPEFPGMDDLRLGLDQVVNIPDTWKSVLTEARGVYLLTYRKTGQQYVGSACGDDGLLGRWLAYADGHGGNVAMRELAGNAGDYDVTILETSGSRADVREILRLEDKWKAKLGSRVQGLNRN